MKVNAHGPGHLSSELLVRSLDGELADVETAWVDSHLRVCSSCQSRQVALQGVSRGLAEAVRAGGLTVSAPERSRLAARLATSPGGNRLPAGKTLVRFGWALAAAASLALGLAYLPFTKGRVAVNPPAEARAAQAASPFEVDGETFVYLPYSNPDLPASGSHIVQMRVPLSSLADAGVLMEPPESRMATPDRTVLADVLLGLDGQPMGIHPLSAD